jgi:hypothetical protein
LAITAETFGQKLTFDNPWAYVSYRVTFPTLKDAAAANSMQIAEVELIGLAGGTLDPNPPAGVDSDGDGTPDDVEIANGTDPNNPGDFFSLDFASATSITWTSGAGQSYDVEYSTDLQSWSVIATIDGTGGPAAFEETDAGRLAEGGGYYRVVLK